MLDLMITAQTETDELACLAEQIVGLGEEQMYRLVSLVIEATGPDKSDEFDARALSPLAYEIVSRYCR